MESRRRRSRSQLLKWGCYVLALFVCAALQTTPGLFQLGEAKPLLVLPLCLAVAVFEGEFAGALLGTVGGLLWDCTAGRTVGMLALELLLLCFAVSVLVQLYLQVNPGNFAAVSTATALVVLSLDWLFFYYMPGYTGAALRYVTFVLPGAALTIPAALLAFWLGHDLKLENVSKRQAAAEFIVERLDQFVHDNMGWHFDKFIPLVGAIFALSIGCNLISVVGLWSPTADLNTEAAWAIVVFIIIMYYKIKTNGILAYLKGLLDPIFLMAPINVLSEVSTPVSMAFRHFGNILSGTVISTLLYWALASLSHVLFGWLPGVLGQIQLFQIGIPAFTGLYFDWFGGCIQAFIFCTLTAIFIKRAAGEE